MEPARTASQQSKLKAFQFKAAPAAVAAVVNFKKDHKRRVSERGGFNVVAPTETLTIKKKEAAFILHQELRSCLFSSFHVASHRAEEPFSQSTLL